MLLIRIYTVCHYIFVFWTQCCLTKPKLIFKGTSLSGSALFAGPVASFGCISRYKVNPLQYWNNFGKYIWCPIFYKITIYYLSILLRPNHQHSPWSHHSCSHTGLHYSKSSSQGHTWSMWNKRDILSLGLYNRLELRYQATKRRAKTVYVMKTCTWLIQVSLY